MIGTLKRIRRNSKIAFLGLQETIIAIADHVNQHVQKTKTNLDVTELESEIKENQVELGRRIYEKSDLQFEPLYDAPDMQDLLKKIETSQKQLEALEAIVSPYEALHDFERLLIRSDFVIQNVIIVDGFHGIGKTIEALALPAQMLIFFIKKKNQINIADGKVIIETRDEVTFLCEKENINTYIELWK